MKYYEDEKLSLSGKGALNTVIQLKKNKSKVTIKGLQDISKNGYISTRKALKECEKLGYLQIIKNRNDLGQFTYDYSTKETR